MPVPVKLPAPETLPAKFAVRLLEMLMEPLLVEVPATFKSPPETLITPPAAVETAAKCWATDKLTVPELLSERFVPPSVEMFVVPAATLSNAPAPCVCVPLMLKMPPP